MVLTVERWNSSLPSRACWVYMYFVDLEKAPAPLEGSVEEAAEIWATRLVAILSLYERSESRVCVLGIKPRTHWRDYISRLAGGTSGPPRGPQEELESVTGEKEAGNTPLSFEENGWTSEFLLFISAHVLPEIIGGGAAL